VRRVAPDGHLKPHRRHQLFLSTVLAGQHVGVTECDEGRWPISFLSFNLSIYDTSKRAFEQLREYSLGESTN